MPIDMSFLIADGDYYQPGDTIDPGPRYQVKGMPPGWRQRDSGPWTHWDPGGLDLPDQGWKVHIASSLTNAQSVLTVVAVACAESGVAFKHLTGHRMFLLMHDKHAARVQAGKFCTLYPQTEDCALRMLRRLETDLSGISGPFVLTDRRFGSSECVSYRYGAFRARTRVDAEGARLHTMLGPDGQEIDDERLPEFRLPPGMSDPFRQDQPAAKSSGPFTLHGYTFERVVQHSNAGGAYRFHSELGEPVFIKEARAHNGYIPDGSDAQARLVSEYLALRAISGSEPGLCPRPVELFQHWEHSYLVTELVPGVSLYRWMVLNNPALHAGAASETFGEYHRRCLALLDQLHTQLGRLHERGFVFVDLSPTNVLVDKDDRIRLVDFEAVQSIDHVRRLMGTPGYEHPDPRSVIGHDARELDRYGLAALALMLLFPVHEAAERHSRILDHLYADLTELAPVPPRLWQRATACRRPTGDLLLPTPQVVRADTAAALRWLADRTADTLEAMAQPDHPDRVYPTIPLGYQTNTRALAAGTAGVLYALHRTGRTCDPAVVRRLRDDALASLDSSVPGLLYGTAGIACVLAELGEMEAAEALFTAAAAHPLNNTSATLGGGAAGTAYGLLAHYRRTGEQRWLDSAQALIERIPVGAGLDPQLSPTAQSGLVDGRAGVALALYHLHRHTGDSRFFDRGMRLLAEEPRYAEPVPVDGLAFRTSPTDPRVYPYLSAGTAGYVSVLSRYLAHHPDAEFTGDAEHRPVDVLERCLRACSVRFTVFPGLFPGLTGLAVALAEAGRRLNRPGLLESALTSARGLFRYAIPRPVGVGWLGQPGQRLSAELWSGSAGILLGLRYLTEPAPGLLNALDTDEPLSRITTTPAEGRDQHGGSLAFAG